MSSAKRIPLKRAQAIAGEVIARIEFLCQSATIAGSVRREQETVGDIEIVVVPEHLLALLVRLDGLLEAGTIQQALYRHKDSNGKVSMRPRWGDKLRYFVFMGVTVELAIGNSDNIGYLLWLRTGPADGGKFVMTRLMIEKAAIRFHDGHGWLCEYAGEHPTYKKKLHLPDERVLFEALGMVYVSPKWRGERLYKANWQGAASSEVLRHMVVKSVEQKKLF